MHIEQNGAVYGTRETYGSSCGKIVLLVYRSPFGIVFLQS
jgi:hypothetical protein